MIKKISTSIILSTVLLMASSETDMSLKEKIQNLQIFKKPNITIQKAQENKSTYQIKGVVKSAQQTVPFEAFVTKDLQEVIFGKGFDTSDEKPLVIPIDMDKYKESAAYSYGDGTDEYFLFTDPECPYCQKFERILPLMKKDVKFYVFFYPLSFHKNAKDMVYYIINQKSDAKKADAMHMISTGSDKYKELKISKDEKAKYDEFIAKEMDIASELGVSGTPSIYNKYGKKVEWPQLLDKYGIQEPVDMQGIEFLKSNGLEIILNSDEKSQKEPAYIMMTPSKLSLKQLEKFIKKDNGEHSLRLFFKFDSSENSLNEVKAIYMQEDNMKRSLTVYKMIDSGALPADELEKAKNMTKDEETKYLPVGYVMQKMNIKPNIDFIVLDENGNKIQ